MRARHVAVAGVRFTVVEPRSPEKVPDLMKTKVCTRNRTQKDVGGWGLGPGPELPVVRGHQCSLGGSGKIPGTGAGLEVSVAPLE